MGRNQRKWERYPCRLAASIRWGKRRLEAESEDVSFHGLFIVSNELPPLRQLLEIELVEPDNGKTKIMGMAVHHSPPLPGRRGGFGVQLFGNDPTARKRWEELIQRLRATWGGCEGPQLEEPPITLTGPAPRPELRVAFTDERSLQTFVSGDLANGVVQIRTPLCLEPGTPVQLVLQHPASGKSFALEAVVGIPADGTRQGILTVHPLHLERDATRRFLSFTQPEPSMDIHVTLDIGSEALASVA